MHCTTNDNINENAQEMTITGPNDARHIVWTKGMCFFSFISCFTLIVFILFRFDLVLNQWKGLGFAGDDDNRPKQHVWRCLGH